MVDLISVSIGKPTVLQYWEDPVAIGSFHAKKHGILTSGSSGNYGPERAVIQNYSPWSLTVAASSIDKEIYVPLGSWKRTDIYGKGLFNIQHFDLLNAWSSPLANKLLIS